MSPTSDGAASVVLAHPNVLIQEAIAGILRNAGFRVVGHTATWDGLQRLVNEHVPDIILLDCDISEFEPQAIGRLSEKASSAIFVVLTRPQSSAHLRPALESGATGYLSVNLPPQDFVLALRMIEQGHLIVASEMVERFKGELTTEQPPKAKEQLSGREREVLNLVGHGATNREIAGELFISEHTVKVHLRAILNKLNLRNRQQAAAYSAREGTTR
ncbi:MAG: response regulator transcription factor, partial [Chloroflexota bacterium]